jgi:hydroxypyruvate reductase
MFDAAVSAAQPQTNMPLLLPPVPTHGRLVVLGAGKASAAMAQAAEKHYGRPLEGLVVTRYGHAVACEGIEIVEAAHPVPDAAGRAAAGRMMALAESLTEEDIVVCLMSGGGSSLMAMPAPGIAFEDAQDIIRQALGIGVTINDLNCLRRHLSAIKGGRLAAACNPAKVFTLLISDVPGNDPANIASGPTEGDPTTCADALEIVDRYGIDLPSHVRAALEAGELESVKPDDPRLAGNQTRFVAQPQTALEAAARVARMAGFEPYILGEAIEGEARDVATVMAGIAHQVATHNQPFDPHCVLISGGETTVSHDGAGRGGRNAEFLLALAIALDGEPGIYAIAGDTDGSEGGQGAAGAMIGPDTLAKARALGLSSRASLKAHDAHGYFKALDALLNTGPTLTNVNDFRAILIE